MAAALPVQFGLVQVAVPFTVVATQSPDWHWLLFVHRQVVLAAFAVPGVQAPRVSVQEFTQPSAPP